MTRSPNSRTQRLLEADTLEAQLARMTPEARAQYERIVQLRDEIGPGTADVVQMLREIREDLP